MAEVPAAVATPAAPTSTPPASTPAAPAPETAVAPEESSFSKFDADIPEDGAPSTTTPAPTKYERRTTPPKPSGQPAAPAAPAAATQAKPDDLPQFKTPKELREWASTRHKTALQLETEKTQLTAKLAELEKRVPQTNADAEKLNSQIATLQKRVDEYENTIRLKDYEQSGEYKEKYQQPYQTAVKRAYREVKELLVTEATGEKDANDQPVMREREATVADFDKIYSLPTGAAEKLARQMFPYSFSTVLNYRKEIRDLAEKAVGAIEEYKGKAATFEKEKQDREAHERTTADTLWRKANDAIGADPKRKSLWGREEDPKLNEALDKGFEIADKLFSEDHARMPVQERIVFDASIRHRIAGFSKLAHINGTLRTENEALKAEIAELRGSAPGKPGSTAPSGGEPGDGKEKSAIEMFDDPKYAGA